MADDTSASINQPKRRRFKLNFLLIGGILLAAALFVWAERERRDVKEQLTQTEQHLEEVRQSTDRGGQELAQEVLGKVQTHIDIVTDPQPTVATIVDINRLREVNEFYQKADNGDHLIITQNRAILYDPDRNVILDVVPVRINDASPSPDGSPNTSPGTSPRPSPQSTTPTSGTDDEDTGQ